MLRSQISEVPLYRTYAVFVREGLVETKLGITSEDGCKLVIERNLSEILTGESVDVYDIVEKAPKIRLEFGLVYFSDTDYLSALPTADFRVGPGVKRLDLPSSVQSLYAKAKTLVLRPTEDLTDESGKITFHKAVNTANIDLTFKPGEKVILPLVFHCFKDRVIGKTFHAGDDVV